MVEPIEPNNVSIIVPKNVETKIESQQGWKVGVAIREEEVIILPPMKTK